MEDPKSDGLISKFKLEEQATSINSLVVTSPQADITLNLGSASLASSPTA